MKRIFKALGLLIFFSIFGLFLYGLNGYWDSLESSQEYIERAETFIKNGKGGEGLGEGRIKYLLMVEDPAFMQHSGVDLWTPGAGLTTITQSLSKRLAFDKFQPGIGKIRQTGFALGLEQTLNKEQILALFLDTVEMGNGPNGWMTGFYKASEDIYSQPPSNISHNEFIKLVAVMISPARFDLNKNDPDLMERTTRISNLLQGKCSAKDFQDVWLKDCD